jgi:PAS domain S-box-containing protein
MRKKDKTVLVPGLQTLLTLSGSIIIFVGSVTFLGWIIGVPVLVNLRSDYLPMAASNSLFFILYGLVFVSGKSKPIRKIPPAIIHAVIGFCSLYGLLQFTGHLVNMDLNFDFTLFPVTEKLGNFPLGHMSPYAGLLFFLSGTAILLKILARERASIQNITAGLGMIVAFAGFVASLGYMFGTPFLYSGDVIPLSLRTALSFLFLGLGLVVMAGEKSVFLRHFMDPTASARLLRILVPLIISLFMFEGILDVIFTHTYKINEALLLALSTLFSIILFSIAVLYVTREVFKSANIAETGRLKATEELKKVNALHSLILENSTMGICMVRNHVFEWNNSRLSEIFQLPQKKLQGVSTSTIFNLGVNSENSTEWYNKMKDGKFIDNVIQLPRSNGDLFWCRFVGTPLDPFNPVEGSVWMVEDITERHLLREKMRLLSHTIECLSECVSITDTTDQIIFVNNAFQKTYGYNQEELLDKSISIISSPSNDPDLISSILPETLKGGWQGEILNRRKDGTEFPVNMASSKVVDENGAVIALVGVATDITARLQAEQQLKKYSEQLKESIAAKDKLFSIIAHDLRSPFNSILGFFQLLTDQYDDFSEDEKKTFLFEIRRSSETTFKLLEDLLTWSRTQTGGIKVNMTKVDLAEIARQQVETLKNVAASKKINLSSNIIPGTFAYADIDMVKTILLNLTSNAIKFTRYEGNITISAKININEIQIEVADNGVGIPTSDLDNIFRLDKSLSTLGTSKEKGTGLGLQICKEFTEKNGGKIWAESELGKGSKFIFTLSLFKI